MKAELRNYARLGLVHHLLYPRCMRDHEYHATTLEGFVARKDIETFDCCLPYAQRSRARSVAAIARCGKTEVGFATHLFPYRKFSFCSPDPNEQAQIRLIIKEMIDQAVAIGATGFVFGSGGPSPADATPSHYAAFAEFCAWLGQELEPYGITGLLEPFDTEIDKKFLYGSTAQCVALLDSLKPQTKNIAIELDLAHVPLMGETFADAIRTSAPYLRRVHLGNCVLKDRTNPRYGDTHPPFGFEGGQIDVPELTEILECLLEVGFLNLQNRGSMLVETTPWPDRSENETVTENFRRLQQAWEVAQPSI